jgi:hypothetical protein
LYQARLVASTSSRRLRKFPLTPKFGTARRTKRLARVLATSPKYVLCSTFLADGANAPPASMTSLPVVKKTSQQGD